MENNIFIACTRSVARTVVLICLCTQALADSAVPAKEQGADGSEPIINEVIVVGVKNKNRSLAEIKQESFTTKDSLNFDALDLLPDDSIGGALNLLAGSVAIVDPTSGQPRFVSLRGFGAQYNSIDFDGIKILNSSANTRGARLDLFPSSLVHELNVFKTLTADMDGNSIGGHASVRTLRAFDGGDEPFARAKLQYGIYDHDGEPEDSNGSYRFDAVGKFTFGPDNQLGAVFGLDAQRHQYSRDSQRFNDGYRQLNGFDVPERDSVFSSIVFQTDIERLNGFAKLEAHANENLYSFASIHYFSQDEIESRNRTGHFVDPLEATAQSPGEVTYSDSQATVSFVDRERNRQTVLGSVGVDYAVGDRGRSLPGCRTRVLTSTPRLSNRVALFLVLARARPMMTSRYSTIGRI